MQIFSDTPSHRECMVSMDAVCVVIRKLYKAPSKMDAQAIYSVHFVYEKG